MSKERVRELLQLQSMRVKGKRRLKSSQTATRAALTLLDRLRRGPGERGAPRFAGAWGDFTHVVGACLTCWVITIIVSVSTPACEV